VSLTLTDPDPNPNTNREVVWKNYWESDEACFLKICDNDNITAVPGRLPPVEGYGKREVQKGRKRKKRFASTGEEGPGGP
jgi:hypothetical protein